MHSKVAILNEEHLMKTGTTTIGIACKNCIILAADTRATMGNLIADKMIDKVIPIGDKMALTTAGSVSGIQMLVKYIQSELRLKKVKSGREPTVKEAANLLRNWVYGLIRRPSMIPDITHFLFAGADNQGVHLYNVAPDGSLFEEKEYSFSGSGSTFALGVLENDYKKGMTQEQGVALAEKCINTAIQRDSASGNGINVFVVDAQGVRKVLSKRVNTNLQ